VAMKWSVVCLVAVAMHGCLSDAQSKYPPIRPLYPPKNRNPVKIQPKELIQSKQQFETPLDWTYPANPVPEAKVYGRSERRSPVAANSVVIFCNENMIHVEAKQDLLGIGELIHIDDLVLGDCAHTGFDNANNVIIFQAELQACGSFLTMTDASLIYSFMLNYKPNPLTSTTIIRTNDVSITVECHYPRKHNVSSMALIPTWTPFSSAKYAEEFLYFSLRLMTADWQYERDSNEFSLGDILNIEASVMQYFHVPLRVFVDSCVATLEPNPNASPNYAFIDNHGCLIDAKITGSHSMFMARSEDHKLHFQLEAFRFGSQKTGSPSQIYHKPTHTSPPKQHDMIYITCHLKAARVSMPIDSNYKACSFVNTWREAGGNDGMCNCCDSTCGTRNARDVTRPKTPAYTWEGDVQLGPIIISEKVM
uniref:Zona pellucida sperm-binding protein 3 n=1 Tax=Esox lucius TaxID=8010 RepID=A0A6Q2Z2A5_ESOLU